MDEKNVIKGGLILHPDAMEMVKLCTDQQAGELIKVLIHYLETEADAEIKDTTVKIIYQGLRLKVYADAKKYVKRCETNRENALKRKSEKGNQPPGGYDWDEV